MANKPWHQGDYRKRAARVRALANANPDTRCWRCGELARPGDPWQAGHVIDGQIGGELRAEHRSCNIEAGNEARHRGTTTRHARIALSSHP